MRRALTLAVLLAGCATHRRGGPQRVPGCPVVNVSLDRECLPSSEIYVDPESGTVILYCKKTLVVNGKVKELTFPAQVNCKLN